MRLQQLNLLAYGKFTSRELTLPRSGHDFHVIIGPNEAGKSTVRRAIRELLFGMERQSPLGFIHPQSDLKLKAVIQTAAGELKFMRTKQQKSLRSLSDEVLPESYLAPGIGSLTEDAFVHLHSLDHTALVKGGRGIVDPSTSVSQVLFQAASGLDSFAGVRDALRERSTELFAGRGKKNEYAAAAERFSAAQKVLKDVQIRSRDWVNAREALREAETALESERKRRAELEQQRSTWERAWRLGSRVEQLDRLKVELAAVGETIAFPSNARKTLESGVFELNTVEGLVQTRQQDVESRRSQLANIQLDDEVLASATEVSQLAQLCGQCIKYPTDIASRSREVELWVQEVLTHARQFGWGKSEEEVRRLVPTDKILRTLESLLKERGGLVEAERGAIQAAEARRTALDDIEEKLVAVEDALEYPALASVLEQAVPFKTSGAKLRAIDAAVAAAKAKLITELQALGRPELDAQTLRALKLPSPERISALRSMRQDLHSQWSAANTRREQAELDAASLALKVRQYEDGNKVVTAGDVSLARRERDGVWSAIKLGSLQLAEGAPQLDANMRLADELADSRTLSEAAGAGLQALREQHESAVQQATAHATLAQHKQRELDEFDAKWSEQAAQFGLDGLELDDMPGWLARREQALAAADALTSKESERETESQAAVDARSQLAGAMTSVGLSVTDAMGLAELCATADELLKGASRARTIRQGLEEQQRAAKTALKQAEQAKEAKTAAVGEWRGRWSSTLATANLNSSEPAEVEAAIHAGREILQLLSKIDAHRVERIDAMQAELDFLAERARQLAQELAPELSESSPQEVSRVMTLRLENSKAQKERHAAASQAVAQAEGQLRDAQSTCDQVKKGLEPLLRLAQVEDPLLVLPLVELADRKRELQEQVKAAAQAIEDDCAGLTLEKLRVELQAHPAADAPGQIQAVKDSLAESERRLTELVQRQVAAEQAFATINGSDSAAVAEAQRQEALADMSEAGEEYVQLATASALLKWAVDRYRDRKQGPLLERASTIFESLTLGSFRKLRIDYDQTPPALLAYRANNQAVRVEGLSDGTRDQLFLALRIAALELQSEHGEPVPFIADDLFINFDDERSQAGLKALWNLSAKTQVIFLSHQEHLLPVVEKLFEGVNVISLDGIEAAV